MVVQLPPAVPPPCLPLSNADDVMETRKILLSAALECLFLGQSVSHTHTHTREREREPKPSEFVLCSHVILCSQRRFFMSGEMDSGGNISAAVGRKFQGLWFSVCLYLSWATLSQSGCLLSRSRFHT